MNTNKLTPGNIKYLAVPSDLHARLKAQAKAQHATLYEVIADWENKAARYEEAAALFPTRPQDATP